jgi:hypothetical protein
MRGTVDEQPPLFHTFCVEDRIRPDHPLRDFKRRTDRILAGCSTRSTRPSCLDAEAFSEAERR